jgi:rubredoxin
MIRELTDDDICPECETVLFLGEAKFEDMTVEFCCPNCDWWETRKVKIVR